MNFRTSFLSACLAGLLATPVWSAPLNKTFLKSTFFKDGGTTATAKSGLATGDVIQFFFQDGGGVGNVPTLQSFDVTIDGAAFCSGAACDGAKYTVPADGAYTIIATGQATPGGTFKAYIQCNGTQTASCDLTSYSNVSAASPTTPTTATPTTSQPNTTQQTTAAQQTAAQQQAAQLAAQRQAAGQASAAAGSSSAGAAGGAISTAMSSRSSGGAGRITTSGAFFATQGQNSSMMVWGGIAGRKFSGSLEGQGGELTLGADWELGSNTVVGVALSYGKYEVTTGGVTLETEALAFGPYVSAELSPGISVDAYVLYARPDYDGAGLSYDADRVIGGVDLNAEYMLGTTQATGYFRLSGFSEDLSSSAPGGSRTITQAMASIGSRFDFAPDAALRPHLSIGADAIRFDNGTTRIESTSPHFGLGLEADAGPGTLSFDVNGNEIFEDARSVSFGIRYSSSF